MTSGIQFWLQNLQLLVNEKLIVISFMFLGESMNEFQIIGGLLILSASYISEVSRNNNHFKDNAP